ncbi:ComEC/Rec2 family competence protein [Kaistella sp.]|uniref:ComEC/Rec2 family competence protein n=1 Tax=Kaistella sp. TaxID=2782235 RepID=UPI002F93BE6B
MFLVFSFLMLVLYLVKDFYFHRIRHVSLFFLFFSLGIFGHFLNSKKPFLPELKSKEVIVFKITKKLNSNEKNRRYEISAWKGKQPFLSVLSVPKSEADLDFLHYYKAEAYINRFQKPYSDFQFDYGKYLSRKDIYFQAYLPNSFQRGLRNDLSFSEKIRQKRLSTLSKIDSANLSKRTREFTKGIILADRTEMDAETVEDFTKSGLMHVLAISGSHMAIIFWLILLVLNPIFPPRFRNYKIIISLILIWAFAIFIDYGNSVVRSCIMISAYYLSVVLQRKPDVLHAMAVAAFGILISDTTQFFDVGFQLSFVAVFGIFWLNQPILKYLPKPKNKFQNLMVNVVSISIAAQIVTLPLVVFYFHQYSVISIVANLIVIPFSEILIIFSLLMTVLIEFSVQISWLNFLYDTVVTRALQLIHFFANLDLAFYRMIPMTLLEMAVGFIIIWFLRFAVITFSLKNVLKVSYFIILFVALRFLLNYRASQINEVLVHHYYKERIISVKTKDEVRFLMRANPNLGKVEKFVIEPYLTSRRIRKFKTEIISDDVEKIVISGKEYHLK